MNTEMMALYKAKGVSPASGCLPMLLTFPLLFAFYALLAMSIELRGAPFIFWIHDLSLRDPYYVLPLIVAVSMFVQQQMMPQPGGFDPAQHEDALHAHAARVPVLVSLESERSGGVLVYE